MKTEPTEINVNWQEMAFVVAYTNPLSKTLGNAFQSALLAGYSYSYARNILTYFPQERIIEIYKLLGDKQYAKKARFAYDLATHFDEQEEVLVINSEQAGRINKRNRKYLPSRFQQPSLKQLSSELELWLGKPSDNHR